MSNAFERAYEAMKTQIAAGSLRAGQHLDLVQLAKTLGVSTSPVREALSALTAERLVQSIKGVGFHVPAFDYAAVVDLIKWSEHLSVACVRAAGPGSGSSDVGIPADHVARTAHLFHLIGRLARNREMTIALANATSRLHHLHRVEPAVLVDAANEVQALERAVEQRSANLSQLLRRYHRRRLAALPKITRQMRSGDSLTSHFIE
ncbi:MAG TPA: GntR family transcriptional regulator [Sphingomonas sp.]|jgi:DNA-binding GntR family transcriptional regulator|nr:GntR family transcriptional regulator [Sphingomonas sp.]